MPDLNFVFDIVVLPFRFVIDFFTQPYRCLRCHGAHNTHPRTLPVAHEGILIGPDI